MHFGIQKDLSQISPVSGSTYFFTGVLQEGGGAKAPPPSCVVTPAEQAFLDGLEGKEAKYTPTKKNELQDLKRQGTIATDPFGDALGQGDFSAEIPEQYDGDFSDYEELELSPEEADTLQDLHARATQNNAEYGAAFVNGVPTEVFTSDLHGKVQIPQQVLRASGIRLFHSHTNCTPPSAMDLRLLTNPNIEEVGVITANGDVYTVSVGDGMRVSAEEFKSVVKQVRGKVDFEMMRDYPDFYEWTTEQRNYMTIREQFYLIVRHFGWTVRGGRM